jgi:hypothetical protein
MRLVRAAFLRIMLTLVVTLLILILAQAVQAAELAPVVEYYYLQP